MTANCHSVDILLLERMRRRGSGRRGSVLQCFKMFKLHLCLYLESWGCGFILLGFIAVEAVLCERQKDEAVVMCVSCVESVLCWSWAVLCWSCVVLKLGCAESMFCRSCVVLKLCCVEAMLCWSYVVLKLRCVEAKLCWSCVVLKLSWSRVRWQLVASEQCACAAVVARSVRVPGRRPSVNIGQWSR